MKNYFLLQYTMTNRKIKEAGMNPFVGYKYDKQEKDGKVGEKEKQVLFYISSNAFITYKELAALIGVTEKSIFENIKKLQKKDS